MQQIIIKNNRPVGVKEDGTEILYYTKEELAHPSQSPAQGEVVSKLKEAFLDKNLECNGAGCIGCWKDVVREAIKMLEQFSPPATKSAEEVYMGHFSGQEMDDNEVELLTKKTLKEEIISAMEEYKNQLSPSAKGGEGDDDWKDTCDFCERKLETSDWYCREHGDEYRKTI